jgi:hypothetical protein
MSDKVVDRYITVQTGTSAQGDARYECLVEDNAGSGSYYLPERRIMDGYSSVSFLVPAGCKFRVAIAPGTNAPSGFFTTVSIYSRKFGK